MRRTPPLWCKVLVLQFSPLTLPMPSPDANRAVRPTSDGTIGSKDPTRTSVHPGSGESRGSRLRQLRRLQLAHDAQGVRLGPSPDEAAIGDAPDVDRRPVDRLMGGWVAEELPLVRSNRRGASHHAVGSYDPVPDCNAKIRKSPPRGVPARCYVACGVIEAPRTTADPEAC